MGVHGPAPKRSDQRRRRNAPEQPVASAPGLPAAVPAPDPEWHPAARRWFESLARSGQRVFYQESDWATAWLLAETISRELNPQPIPVGHGESSRLEYVEKPPSGAAVSAWLKGMAALLVTEGDRRRAQVELTLPATDGGGEEAGSVSSLDAWRGRLDGTG